MEKTFLFEPTHVCVGYDYNEYAQQAIAMAALFSKLCASEVSVINVQPELTQTQKSLLFPYAAMGNDEVQIMSEFNRISLKQIKEHMSSAKLEQPAIVRLLTPNQEGHVASTLLKHASTLNADMLFVGSHGPTPNRMGHVASVVSWLHQNTMIPLWVVKQITRQAKQPRRILLYLHTAAYADAILKWAASIALWFDDCDIDILINVPDFQNCDLVDMYDDYRMPKRLIQTATSKAQTIIENTVKTLSIPFRFRERAKKQLHFKSHVEVGNALANITKKAEEIQADILILSTKSPSLNYCHFTYNLVNNLLGYLPVDMLILPEASVK